MTLELDMEYDSEHSGPKPKSSRLPAMLLAYETDATALKVAVANGLLGPTHARDRMRALRTGYAELFESMVAGNE